jgi:hypothetical protein
MSIEVLNAFGTSTLPSRGREQGGASGKPLLQAPGGSPSPVRGAAGVGVPTSGDASHVR